MKRYSIYSLIGKWDGAIKLSYFDSETIASIEFPEAASNDTLLYFSESLPITLDLFKALLVSRPDKIRAVDCSEQVTMDLSFDNFWKSYGKYRGSKDEVAKLWYGDKKTKAGVRITDQDQRDILTILPKYLLDFSGEQNKYLPLPHTFLCQRLWIAELERSAPKPKKQLNETFLEKRNLPPLPDKGISLKDYLASKPAEEIGIIQTLIKG